ncbi:MAG TPA: MlaD family protein [Solirubrobacterales bacterium]|nr:MlaD family protein [Solirubrobacterales bacterium]
MNKQAPSTGQLIVIAGFALSCFGILLFLWITFGGPTPFRAKTYEIKVPFAEATQLAEQSDVRISGVSVGKVKSIGLSPDGELALATIDILDQYAPIPRETRAILRTKTLLGETYVELTPSSSDREMLPDGGSLAAANVAESVQLDEIFRTFDPETQAAFRTWMQDAAVAIQGRGGDFSNVFGEFEPTFATFDRLFRVLDTQRLAVRQLFRNGEVTFRAFRGRNDELDDLIQSSNTVFTTAAARNRDIEALFRAFPTFLDESRLTLRRLESFSLNADPLFRQLTPAAEELSPTLIAFSRFAPQAKGFFEGFAPVIARSPRAFPALRKLFRDDFPPLLRALDPFLRNLNPLLSGLNLYRREITGVMANVAATFNAVAPTPTEDQVHYLRSLAMLGPDSLAAYPNRLTVNRASAYSQPGAARGLAAGLPSFETRQCSSGIVATLDPNTPNDPDFNARTDGDVDQATNFFERLKQFAFGSQDSSSGIPAPGCVQQAPFAPIGKSGAPTTYQQVFPQEGQ